MLRRFIWLAVFGCVPLASTSACSRETVLADGSTPDNTGFVTADAGNEGGSADGDADASAPETQLMCPVTECTAPRTTCPSSAFPCDVDLMFDDDNCGSCGVRCDGPKIGHSKWSCVEGKCTFSCDSSEWRNCDGNPTNGCEAPTADTNNCGVCGKKCAAGESCYQGDCMTQCEIIGAPDECPDLKHPPDIKCTDKRKDDENCAACGNACDPTGPGLPPLPSDDMYYGCGAGKCTSAKCKEDGKANCNFDLNDGCEATMATEEHCSSCADKCAPGQICFNDPFTGPHCICAPGETRCFGFLCVRLDDDPRNCGGCNHRCPGSERPNFEPSCSFGVCGGQCEAKFADCDGLTDNGCEIDTRVDNRNCGGCGRACLPGQVCAGGECQVAPCEPEGPTTK